MIKENIKILRNTLKTMYHNLCSVTVNIFINKTEIKTHTIYLLPIKLHLYNQYICRNLFAELYTAYILHISDSHYCQKYNFMLVVNCLTLYIVGTPDMHMMM